MASLVDSFNSTRVVELTSGAKSAAKALGPRIFAFTFHMQAACILGEIVLRIGETATRLIGMDIENSADKALKKLPFEFYKMLKIRPYRKHSLGRLSLNFTANLIVGIACLFFADKAFGPIPTGYYDEVFCQLYSPIRFVNPGDQECHFS